MAAVSHEYAIGGIFFLGVWVWNEFSPGHLLSLVPQQKAAAMLAMKYAIGKICFHGPSHTVRLAGGLRENVGHKIFPSPFGGALIELSHERFKAKKVLSDESLSSMNSSGGLAVPRLITFLSNRVQSQAGLKTVQVWPITQSKEPWIPDARSGGSCQTSACRRVSALSSAPRSGG